MKLNWFEFLMMNNPVRAAIQKYIEARHLLRLGGRVPGAGEVLEIGCGRGVGAGLILDMFGASRVHGVDLDPRMVARAERRQRRRGGRATFEVGDVERIEAADQSYDAVFDFGILHHVPDWRTGIHEIARVLRPGGRFYCEEIFAALLRNRAIRMTTRHPASACFEPEELHATLGEAGLEIVSTHAWGRHVGWVVAARPKLGN